MVGIRAKPRDQDHSTLSGTSPPTFMADNGPKLIEQGYLPVPIEAGQKRPTRKGWPEMTLSVGQCQHAYRQHGVGIITGRAGSTGAAVYAVDVDVTDEAVSAKLVSWLVTHLGGSAVPMRTGNAPKVLFAYRGEPGQRKRRRAWTDAAGETQAVEILGKGQQFVALGLHPKTGKAYTWAESALVGALHDEPAAGLRVLEPAEVDQLFAAFDEIAAAAGWTQPKRAELDNAERGVAHAPSIESIDRVRDMLSAIPNDMPEENYERWRDIGMAVHSATGGSAEGEDLFCEWSAQSPRHNEEFLRGETWPYFDSEREGGITVATLRHHARQHGWVDKEAAAAVVAAFEDLPAEEKAAPTLIDAKTHNEHALNLLTVLTRKTGHKPVGAEGSLFVTDETCLWKEHPKLSVEVSSLFDGMQGCKRTGDYAAIGNHAIAIATQVDYFDEAPVGVAVGRQFLRLADGQVVREPLTPEHRQRFALSIEPADVPTPMFDAFLAETFAHADPVVTREQIELLQEVMGSTVLGTMARYEKALFLYGKTRAGKGTLQKIVEALVPKVYRSALAPFKWNQEYYIAALAGKRLNIVGELPADEKLPAAVFKTVTGRDTLMGRHPTHRPFDFVNQAAHWFSSNHLISTTDVSDAFFSRWIVLTFPNSRIESGGPIDTELASRIVVTRDLRTLD